MIWLLLNAWWLVLALVALCAGLALLSGIGGPALVALARRVPALAWAALLAFVALSIGSSWLVGVGEARCQSAQATAEDKADIQAAKTAGRASVKAETATKTTRKEASDAQAEARVIVRSLPAACPGQPPRLRELGDAAVEAARRSVPAAADG